MERRVSENGLKWWIGGGEFGKVKEIEKLIGEFW